jgi:Cdc6-like AAA superfamily ATPase
MKFFKKDYTLDSTTYHKFNSTAYGREEEYKQLLSLISENETSHILLTGVSGVGKTCFINSLDEKLKSLPEIDLIILIKINLSLKDNTIIEKSFKNIILETLGESPFDKNELNSLIESIKSDEESSVYPEFICTSHYLDHYNGKIIFIIDDISIGKLNFIKKIPKFYLKNIMFIFVSESRNDSIDIFKYLLYKKIPTIIKLNPLPDGSILKIIGNYSISLPHDVDYIIKKSFGIPFKAHFISHYLNKLPIRNLKLEDNIDELYNLYFNHLFENDSNHYEIIFKILCVLMITRENISLMELSIFLDFDLNYCEKLISENEILFCRTENYKLILFSNTLKNYLFERYKSKFDRYLLEIFLPKIFKLYSNNFNNNKYFDRIKSYIYKNIIQHSFENENYIYKAEDLILNSNFINDQVSFFNSTEVSIESLKYFIKNYSKYYEKSSIDIKLDGQRRIKNEIYCRIFELIDDLSKKKIKNNF